MRNDGDGTFTDVAAHARVDNPTTRGAREYAVTWGLAFYDFNADGWEDLYVDGGSLQRVRSPDEQPNSVYVNNHNGTFLDLSSPSRANDPQPSRGAAFADYNRDGREDVFVVNQKANPDLYKNVTNIKGEHWLEVHTIGGMGRLPLAQGEAPYSNRDGCGARVTATLSRTVKLVREVFCGSTSQGSGSDPTLYFGLGTATSVKSLRIEWPSGIVQTLRNLKVDRYRNVMEPSRT